ncbi:MAG: GtrA family protein [Alphaproteobacteria bacterium]|nr:GtrA family protein [Alphaproteobacteria bacterium]
MKIKGATYTPETLRAEFLRLFRFGIVGLSAFFVNWIVVVLIVSAGLCGPLAANVVAFLTAFSVSYFGHRGWTFSGKARAGAGSFWRFAVVAGIGFLVNESSYYVLLDVYHIDYRIGLVFAVGLAAVCTYILSALWAFNAKEEAA